MLRSSLGGSEEQRPALVQFTLCVREKGLAWGHAAGPWQSGAVDTLVKLDCLFRAQGSYVLLQVLLRPHGMVS